MKRKLVVAILVAFLAVPALVNANITSWYCDDDNDGAIVMGTQNWSGGSGEYTLAWNCTQSDYPGHVEGTFTTDGLDPKVLIDETVLNDTGVAWNDYHITIGMSQSFSISNIITPDAGWTYNVTPVAAGNIPNGGPLGYVATINYYMGTGSPILDNTEGEFGFKLTFLGDIAFCTEQVPSFVPEPATMALLGLGALVLRKKK